MRSNHRHLKGGFTVLELSLVITTLLVLSLLLMGSLSSLRGRSKSAECVSQLRHNAVLIHQAIAEGNGMLPWYDKSLKAFDGLWWHKIWKSSGLSAEAFSKSFTCPADTTPRQIPVGSEKIRITYRYNKRTGYHDGSKWIYANRRLSQHRAPATAPILADSSWMPTDNAPAFDEWNHIYSAHGGPRYYEGNYANVLFLDGHVGRIEKPPEGQTVPGNYDLKMRDGF